MTNMFNHMIIKNIECREYRFDMSSGGGTGC